MENSKAPAIINKGSIDDAYTLIRAMALKAFQTGVIPQNVMLHGSPGVGKSSIVRQLRDEVEKVLTTFLGRKIEVVLIDIRLAAEEAATVQGVPFVYEGEVRYGTPQWFPTDPTKFYILFFDEMTNATKSVQHAAYRVLLERTIQNGKKLPDTCMILSAGNLKSDKTGAMPLLPALANRYGLHFHIDNDKLLQPFLNYAVNNGFESRIISFIENNLGSLFRAPAHEEAWPSPRTWEEVDKHLKNEFIPEEMMNMCIAGAVGSGESIAFASHCAYYDKLPEWKRIRSGDESYEYKLDRSDGILGSVLGIECALQTMDSLQHDNMEEANNLGKFMNNFSKEIKIITFKTMKRNYSLMKKIMQSAELRKQFDDIKPFIK